MALGAFPDWDMIMPSILQRVNEFACSVRYSTNPALLEYQKETTYKPPPTEQLAAEPKKKSNKRKALGATAPRKHAVLCVSRPGKRRPFVPSGVHTFECTAAARLAP